MTTTTILVLLSLAHLVAFVAVAVYVVRSHRRDAARLTAFLDAMARGYPGAPVDPQPVAPAPPAPVSGIHAVPTGDAAANDDERRTLEMAVWSGDRDTGERPSVEELTTVHVPVSEALPSLLSGGTKAALGRLASGTTGQAAAVTRYVRPDAAETPANVRRVKGGAR